MPSRVTHMHNDAAYTVPCFLSVRRPPECEQKSATCFTYKIHLVICSLITLICIKEADFSSKESEILHGFSDVVI